jgi:hypothetical protein
MALGGLIRQLTKIIGTFGKNTLYSKMIIEFHCSKRQRTDQDYRLARILLKYMME